MWTRRGCAKVHAVLPANSDDTAIPRQRAVDMASAVACARGLTKRYREIVAVDDVTLALEPGTITGFLGPNGAGKTTTLRLLLGLAQPTAGEALVFGRPTRRELLARHAAEARTCRRVARRPAIADPGRACEWPRSGRRALV